MMRLATTLWATGAFMAAVVFCFCAAVAAPAPHTLAESGDGGPQPLVIRFPHVVAENTPKGRGARHFQSCANERLKGRVEVQVFPNSRLYSDNSVLDAIMLGQVQMGAPSLSKFDRYTRKLQLFDLPFLFTDLDAVNRFQAGPEGRALLRSMEDKGILGLAYWHNGMKQISANVPLREPEDVRGLRFRIQHSDLLAAKFEAMGAIPVRALFSEVFSLLQTRAIDGQENTWSNMYSQRFHEVQNYITETNHGLIDYMVVTNIDFWNGLPADLRDGLDACMTEATETANRLAREKARADRRAIIESGRVRVLTLDDDQLLRWRKAMLPVWAAFEPEIGADLIAAAEAANWDSASR